MPEISHKGRTMPDSPIRKLASFANGAKDRGTHVIHLNIGQPDIATPPQALEAIRGMNREVLEYSPSEGFASYRDGLSRYYATVGVAVTPEEIMVTTGGSEALVFCLHELFESRGSGDHPRAVLCQLQRFCCLGAGIEIVPVTASIENGFALPSMAAFEAAITDRTKAILICNPGNPTGTKYADESLHAVADLVKQRDLFLFADEVYREFTYDGNMSPSVLSLDGLEEHAIVIDSVSKRYSMCGARIGAMVTKNEEIRRAAMRFAMARTQSADVGASGR